MRKPKPPAPKEILSRQYTPSADLAEKVRAQPKPDNISRGSEDLMQRAASLGHRFYSADPSQHPSRQHKTSIGILPTQELSSLRVQRSGPSSPPGKTQKITYPGKLGAKPKDGHLPSGDESERIARYLAKTLESHGGKALKRPKTHKQGEATQNTPLRQETMTVEDRTDGYMIGVLIGKLGDGKRQVFIATSGTPPGIFTETAQKLGTVVSKSMDFEEAKKRTQQAIEERGTQTDTMNEEGRVNPKDKKTLDPGAVAGTCAAPKLLWALMKDFPDVEPLEMSEVLFAPLHSPVVKIQAQKVQTKPPSYDHLDLVPSCLTCQYLVDNLIDTRFEEQQKTIKQNTENKEATEGYSKAQERNAAARQQEEEEERRRKEVEETISELIKIQAEIFQRFEEDFKPFIGQMSKAQMRKLKKLPDAQQQFIGFVSSGPESFWEKATALGFEPKDLKDKKSEEVAAMFYSKRPTKPAGPS